MRKDVRTGAVIGGLLIAVLILYGVVASRSQTKKPGGGSVAVKTNPAGPEAAGGTDHPDGAPTDSPAAAAPADGAPSPIPNPGVPPAAEAANAPAPAPDPAAVKSAVSWATLLKADNVDSLMPVRTQTPDAAESSGPIRSHGAQTPKAETPPPTPRPLASDAGESANPTPAPTTPPEAVAPIRETSTSNYTVKSGDTFSSIARAAYGDARFYKKIMAANPKINPNRMRAGITIVLPGRSSSSGDSSTSEAITVSEPPVRHTSPKPMAAVDSNTEYRVVSSDSLYKIAMKLYHSPNKVDAIYQLNKSAIGADPAKLKLNMILKLPEPPTQSASTR